jgi:2-amino-4-hydroxy-6-hydroxymethyldihydropteridine diphosphokinase
MNKVIVGLGSNIDPQKNIKEAKEMLSNEFNLLGESLFIETEPIGYKDQDNFINGSVYIETDLSRENLKNTLRKIEDKMGRSRSPLKFGPRTIDLDIVVFNNLIVDNDFYDRDFVKNAVLQLIPNLEY